MLKTLPFLAMLALTGCVVGTHIVTGTARPAVLPASVRIYSSAPTNCEVIGIITAEYAAAGQKATDMRVEELKRQAGMLGANGILLTAESTDTSHQPARIIPTGTGLIYIPATDSSAVKLSGTAIYVP